MADLRAPTASAAAELVVHRKQEFQAELENRIRRMSQLFRLRLAEARQRLTELRMHRVFHTLASRLADKAQRVDDCVVVLDKAIRQRLGEARQEWLRVAPGVGRYDLQRLLGLKRATLDQRAKRFQTEFSRYLAERRNRLDHLQALLRERSPLVILGRGYSITRDASGSILRDAAAVPVGAAISVRLALGELDATVRDKKL